MNILIVGSGGREHAIAWKLRQSPRVEKIYIAAGNAGTAIIGENVPVDTMSEILEWISHNTIDLVIIQQDQHLADGLTDAIRKMGIAVFGPSKAAAEIEWSKSFAKQLMQKARIPTAASMVFSSPEEAKIYCRTQIFPLVIKADGLAQGKGVIIVHDMTEAIAAIERITINREFGNAGNEILIEEYLEGIEFSVHAFSDGKHIKMFPSSQDYKRAYDGDNGPNTGGMGTIAPVPGITAEILQEVELNIVLPCIQELAKLGRPFIGVLYPGIMLTKNGLKVIEFNARFGDPETQSYVRLLKTDLIDIMLACIDQKLDTLHIEWVEGSACCVALASKGYPGECQKGFPITGISEAEKNKDVVLFHAGMKQREDKIITNGGRVLGVSAIGSDLSSALNKVYEAIDAIDFKGMEYRTDIGAKALKSRTSTK